MQVQLLRTLVLGGVAAASIASSMPAHAATNVGAFASESSVVRPEVTQVHWEWRHHHRYWVPDRRHDDHHDDRR